jgi:hypothetical protein
MAISNESNISCTAISNIYKVTVNPLPVATAGSNSPVCKYYDLELTADGGTSYSWTGPYSFSSLEQNPVRSFFTQTMAGTYTVTVTNEFGCTATASTDVVMGSAIYYQVTNNSPMCEGSILNLAVTSGADSYSWSGPNGFTSSLQNPTRSDITIADAGMYTVIATDACGSSYATTIVAVNPRPNVTISGSPSECVGATGILYTLSVVLLQLAGLHQIIQLL